MQDIVCGDDISGKDIRMLQFLINCQLIHAKPKVAPYAIPF